MQSIQAPGCLLRNDHGHYYLGRYLNLPGRAFGMPGFSVCFTITPDGRNVCHDYHQVNVKLQERRNEALKWELLRQGGSQEKFEVISKEVPTREARHCRLYPSPQFEILSNTIESTTGRTSSGGSYLFRSVSKEIALNDLRNGTSRGEYFGK